MRYPSLSIDDIKTNQGDEPEDWKQHPPEYRILRSPTHQSIVVIMENLPPLLSYAGLCPAVNVYLTAVTFTFTADDDE